MPQWAGSCWYELRYLDPANDKAFVDPDIERYWMGPRSTDRHRRRRPVRRRCRARRAAPAVRALLAQGAATTWGTCRPASRSGGCSTRATSRRTRTPTPRGIWVPAEEVVERDGQLLLRRRRGHPALRQDGQVAAERGDAGRDVRGYGADTFRVYEMSMGPLDVSRPWETRAVVGVQRFLQRVWRAAVDERTGAVARQRRRRRRRDQQACCTARSTGSRADMAGLRFNTAIAKLIELTNRITAVASADGRPACGDRAAGADAGAGRAAHRRGAVAAAGASDRRWPTSRSRSPTRRCWPWPGQ